MMLKNKWFLLFILLLATILSPLDFYIVNLALPAIQQSLQATNSELQMIVSFYTCAYAVFQISGGRLGDIYGRKNVFILGLFGFVFFSALCGCAQSSTMIIVGRIGQGVSGAIMIPQVLAIVQGIFNEKEKRLVMALYSFTFGIAAALGQYLGALLIEWNLFDLGWRIIFLVNLPVGILALLLALVALPKQEIKTGETIDYQGTLFLTLGLMSFIYPLTTSIEDGITLHTIGYLLGAIVFIYLFVRFEKERKREGKSVLVDFDIFQYRNLKLGVIISFLYYASGVFYLVFGIYLQKEWHWSSMEAGKAIIPFGVGFIVMSLCSSILSKYLKEALLSVGLMLYMLGFILLMITLYQYHPIVFKVNLFVIGCGMGLTLASVVRLSLSNIPIQFAGLASGAVNCGLQIGSAFGVAALGSVFFALTEIKNYTFAFAFVLGLICLLLLIAFYLSLRMRKGWGE
ncbi:MFS transporter [Myroides sp. TSA_177.3]|uniref:MFS transporter n=1 Tax=Myroides sp. TSA_177.3 TaxID=3415650 RepID=UPI0040466C29